MVPTKFVPIMLLAAALPSLAQTGAGSIQGTVKDPTGAVIPAATVEVTLTETGQKFSGTTNNAGLYVFPSLQPGPYRVHATAGGMQPWEGELTLRTGQTAVIDIALAVGTASTQLTVAGDVSQMVSTASATIGTTIERARIEQLPLNGRNIVAMMQSTVPGMEGGTSEVYVYGLRYGAMEFVQDGAVMSNRNWGYPAGKPPGLDTVAEFKVETNNASAKNNRPATAIMSTRSGTNQPHGSLFETARNDGIGVARRREDFYQKAPPLIRNEFGASVGGPVFVPEVYNGANRTFFFFSYEGYKRRQYATQSTSVPTLAMRQGDFSKLIDAQSRQYILYDPLTTDAAGMRVPFTGNQIPVARRSALATHLYNAMPAPTFDDVNPVVGDNWFGVQPNNQDQYGATLRVDHRFSTKDQAFLRLTAGKTTTVFNNGNNGSPILSDGTANVRRLKISNPSAAFSWTHIFGPTFFGETLISFGREDRSLTPGDPGTNWASQLGLPNPFGRTGFPEIGNIGFKMGTVEAANAYRDLSDVWNFDQNFTKVHGRHEFQFGGRYRRDRVDTVPQQQYVKGYIQFNSGATSLYDPTTGSTYGALVRTGFDAANFYLGIFSSYQITKTLDWFRFSAREYAGYIQDNWKVTSRLTLNLGLRLERYPVLNDRDKTMTGFDPKSKAVVLGRPLDELYSMGATNPGVIQTYQAMGAKFVTAQEAGLPDNMATTDPILFGPRIGFAYRVTTGARPLVLRGGYSKFAFPINMREWNAVGRSNVPLFTRYTYNPNGAATSPDGKPNYLLRHTPTYVAGVNTTNLIDPAKPDPGGKGSFGAGYFATDQPNSRSSQWNVTLERELLENTVVRAAMLGNSGSKLDQFYDWNEEMPNYVWFVKTGLPLPTGDNASIGKRPWNDQPYGTLRAYSRTGWSDYYGVQLEAERRFSKGIGGQVNYLMSNSYRAGANAWSDSSLEDPWVFLDGTVPSDVNQRNRFLNYQRYPQVAKHRVRWNWIADLPFGRGKQFGRNAGRVLDRFIGGWQIAGFGNMQWKYFALPTTNWGAIGDVDVYGKQYAVNDCRSGRCISGYLYYNGYIPANRINSTDVKGNPNGVMGVPSSYQASSLPVWPWPTDGGSPTDPNYKFFGTQTVFVKMKDGSLQQVALNNGLHPWRNQYLLGPMQWNMDASLFKAVAITERLRLRFNADFFNVLNRPGTNFPAADSGIISNQTSSQDARTLQLTIRLIW